MNSSRRKLAAHCLLLFSAMLITAADAGGETMRLIGTWELVGLGDETGNISRPQRTVMSFSASGEFKLSIWEHGEAQPYEASGRFNVSDDVLELTLGVPEEAESYRIRWDGSHLVLNPTDAPPHRSYPLRFEKRPWELERTKLRNAAGWH